MANAEPAPARRIPLLVAVQVVVALVALLVLAVVALRIGPLLEEKAQLERDIAGYEGQVTDLRAQLESTRAALEKTRAELESARQQLAETADMARFTFPVDLVDLKSLASRFPDQARALQLILDLRSRDVGWHLGGQTPEQGFDSPGFAAFVLSRLGALPQPITPGDSLLATSRKLFALLPRRPAGDEQVGDLVLYPAGYALFRFVDERNHPYVIGMTPMGIVALKPDFARPLAAADTGLGG